jgi:NIPSNAP protein
MLRRLSFLIALTALVWMSLAAQAQQVTSPTKPVYELRIYKLNPANKQHFHDRFRDRCMPIMKRYGFDIVFTSETSSMGPSEFVYLLRWPDDEVRTKAWKAFLSDPEWVAIKKSSAAKYGDLVEDVQDRQLQLMPYTPAPSTVP